MVRGIIIFTFLEQYFSVS